MTGVISSGKVSGVELIHLDVIETDTLQKEEEYVSCHLE